MGGLKVWIAGICALVLAGVLAGCETIDRTVDTTDAAGISRIGVSAGLSDEMIHLFVGTLVFENVRTTRPVPEWEMSAYVETVLAAELEKSPKISNVGIVDVTGLDRTTFPDSQAGLLAAAKAQGFDTVAVVLPTSYSNFPYVEPGYGIYRKVTFGIRRSCVYQQTVVYVLDVATGKRLAWEWGFNSWDGPCRKLQVPFKESVNAYTDEEMAVLKRDVQAAFDLGLERTVRKLGLGTAGAAKSSGSRPH